MTERDQRSRSREAEDQESPPKLCVSFLKSTVPSTECIRRYNTSRSWNNCAEQGARVTACLNKYVEQTSTMVTRILTLVRVRTAPAAIAGQCSSSTQNTHNQNYRRLFNDDEKIILPAAAASAVEAKKEDDKPGDLNRGDSQLREAEATVATKHIMQRLRGSGSVQVQRAKMLC